MSEKAHKSTVWLAKALPQNRDLFMTGGGNGGFNLYKYHYPAARTKQAKDQKPMGVRTCTCELKYMIQSEIKNLLSTGVSMRYALCT